MARGAAPSTPPSGSRGKGAILRPGHVFQTLAGLDIPGEQNSSSSESDEDEYSPPQGTTESSASSSNGDEADEFTEDIPDAEEEPEEDWVDPESIARKQFGEGAVVDFHFSPKVHIVPVETLKAVNSAPATTAKGSENAIGKDLVAKIQEVFTNSFSLSRKLPSGKSKTIPRAVVVVLAPKPGKKPEHRIVAVKEEEIVRFIFGKDVSDTDLGSFATGNNLDKLEHPGIRKIFQGNLSKGYLNVSPWLAAKFRKMVKGASSQQSKSKKAQPDQSEPTSISAPHLPPDEEPQASSSASPRKRNPTESAYPKRTTSAQPKKQAASPRPSKKRPAPEPDSTVSPHPKRITSAQKKSQADASSDNNTLEETTPVDAARNAPTTKGPKKKQPAAQPSPRPSRKRTAPESEQIPPSKRPPGKQKRASAENESVAASTQTMAPTLPTVTESTSTTESPVPIPSVQHIPYPNSPRPGPAATAASTTDNSGIDLFPSFPNLETPVTFKWEFTGPQKVFNKVMAHMGEFARLASSQ